MSQGKEGFTKLQNIGKGKQVQLRPPVLEEVLENHEHFENRDTAPDYETDIQIENRL